MILMVLIIVPCLLVGAGTYAVLRHFDLPVPASRDRPRLNIDASSRGFVIFAGTTMLLWIFAWLVVLVGGLVILYGF